MRTFLSRLLDVVLASRRERRLHDEIQAHLDLLTDQFVSRGMTPADARLAARRAFGGLEQMKEAYRDRRGLPVIDALTQDVRFAVRLLRRNRGFAVTAVLVLGLGIGVNNMLFAILNAHTIRGLPIRQVDRVVYVSTLDDRNADRGVSYPDFDDLKRRAQRAMDLAAFTTAPVTVSGDGHAAERIEGAFVTADAFALIGVQPLLGRGFSPEDDKPGAPAVVLLSHGAWKSRYGGDPAALGRSILVNGAPAAVIGVVPDRSGFPSTSELWLPLWQSPGLAAQTRNVRTLRVFGRIRDGIPFDAARGEIEAIADRLALEHPETNTRVRARVVPINERFLGRLTDPAWLAFMTAGCLVVLISCANVANLMLARSVQRTREIAIRASLGAARRRVVRQLLIESAVLATLGGTLGLCVSIVGARLFRSAIPENTLPYWLDYSMDVRVVAALVSVSIGTLFVFALLPAIHTSKTDISRVLKDSARTGTERRAAQRWTTAFLAAEFGLAVVLFSQLALSFHIARPPLPSDLAIDTRDVLTAAITLPREAYATPQQRTEFYRRLDERLRSIPGVSSMSAASVLPLQGATEARLELQGVAQGGGASQRAVWTVAVGPRYFETLDMTISRGRRFTDEDGTPGQPNAIVNERFARLFFEGQNPIGQRIAIRPQDAGVSTPSQLTIVGVAPDIRQRPLPDPDPIVYLPYRASPQAAAVVLVRGRIEPKPLATLVRSEVAALDANVPLFRMRTLSQAVRDAEWNGRLSHMLILVLTAIAVGLSTVGLYAVTAHMVSQRTHEIGVRMALGARPGQVVRIIARRVVLQLAIGFALGTLFTILWDSTFSSGRPALRAADPRTLIVVAGMLAAVACIACFVPARRAMRLDPVAAIRHE